MRVEYKISQTSKRWVWVNYVGIKMMKTNYNLHWTRVVVQKNKTFLCCLKHARRINSNQPLQLTFLDGGFVFTSDDEGNNDDIGGNYLLQPSASNIIINYHQFEYH